MPIKNIGFILILFSCQTVAPQSQIQVDGTAQEARLIPQQELALKQPFQRASCPPVSKPCTERYDPVQCSTNKHRGRSFLPGKTPMAWGENDCLGLEQLNHVVCRLKLKPSDLDGVQCIPDGSRGACHLEKPKCPKDDKVYVCASDTYNQQKLQKTQILKAWGYGACEARWELVMKACQANLNPNLVGKISCEQDLVTSDCIKGIDGCFDKIATTTCKGVLKKSEQVVEGTADSECAAKAILSLQSCVLGESPASLNEVVCRCL